MINFLALHEGKRSIVVLDEIEKSSDDARDALLRILDLGEKIS